MEIMFKVGFTRGNVEDSSRSNWAGDGSRPLAWSAWYPTEDPLRKTAVPEEPVRSFFLTEESVDDARLASRQAAYPLYCSRTEPGEQQPVLVGSVNAWPKQASLQSASIIMVTPLRNNIVRRASCAGGNALGT
jgi:hypothetical protein